MLAPGGLDLKQNGQDRHALSQHLQELQCGKSMSNFSLLAKHSLLQKSNGFAFFTATVCISPKASMNTVIGPLLGDAS